MSKCLIYGIGFFVATLLIQRIVHGINKNWLVYTGTSVIIGMCVFGIMQKEIAFFAAIIGFVLADTIGAALGWHK